MTAAIATSTPATLEQFRCVPWRSWMLRELCAKRHEETSTKLDPANGRPARGLKIASGECAGCMIGAEHLEGERPTSWPDGSPIETRIVDAPSVPPPAKRAKGPHAPPRPSWMPPIGAPPTKRQLRVVYDGASGLPNRSDGRSAPELSPTVNAGGGGPGVRLESSASSSAVVEGVTAGETAPPLLPPVDRPGDERGSRANASGPAPAPPTNAREETRMPAPRMIKWKGESKSASDWSRELGNVSTTGVLYRDKVGKNPDGSSREASSPPPSRTKRAAATSAVEDVRSIAQAQDPIALLERLGVPHELVGETPKGRIVLFPARGDA